MKKLNSIALTALAALFAFSGIAFAQDAAQPPGTPAPQDSSNSKVIKEKRADLREAVKNILGNFKTESKDLRIETKEKMREATTSTERREIKKGAIEERKDLIETRKAGLVEIKDQRKELVEERKEGKAEMRDQRKELARQHGNAMGQRFGVAIKQFDNLSARIQSRIDKLKSAGIETNSAESALNTAKLAMEQAKTDAKALSDLVAQVNSATDAKALRPQVSMPASSTRAQVETAVKKVNASIKSAHRALEAASKQLVTVARSQRRTATSTREDN